MSELFDKSIRTLELPAVLRMLADQTNSAASRVRALAAIPQTDAEDVERLQDLSTRWLRCLFPLLWQ